MRQFIRGISPVLIQSLIQSVVWDEGSAIGIGLLTKLTNCTSKSSNNFLNIQPILSTSITQPYYTAVLLLHSCIIAVLLLHSCIIAVLLLHSCIIAVLLLHRCIIAVLLLHSCIIAVLLLHSCIIAVLLLHSLIIAVLLLHSLIIAVLLLHSLITQPLPAFPQSVISLHTSLRFEILHFMLVWWTCRRFRRHLGFTN